MGQPRAQIIHEDDCRITVTSADEPRRSLVSASIAVHIHMSPTLAGAALAFATFFVHAVNESPRFIDQEALAGQPDRHSILIPSSGLTSIDHALAHVACA